jgi:hypothetical protein
MSDTPFRLLAVIDEHKRLRSAEGVDTSGGVFESINRPTAGATFERDLPKGKHALQLYNQGVRDPPPKRSGHRQDRFSWSC